MEVARAPTLPDEMVMLPWAELKVTVFPEEMKAPLKAISFWVVSVSDEGPENPVGCVCEAKRAPSAVMEERPLAVVVMSESVQIKAELQDKLAVAPERWDSVRVIAPFWDVIPRA